jgi:hypothetical protein
MNALLHLSDVVWLIVEVNLTEEKVKSFVVNDAKT